MHTQVYKNYLNKLIIVIRDTWFTLHIKFTITFNKQAYFFPVSHFTNKAK